MPLPWLAAPLAQALNAQRGHALLVHAPPGLGALAFGLTLAQAGLCEAAPELRSQGPCGRCGSCHLVQSHVHPDLVVLLPETLRRAHGWPLADDKIEGEDSKRKPSKQIRINEVRTLIDWSTMTSARGRGKVGFVHPADVLNLQSANALLKTLEEPPVGTRLILTTADPALLLPTVRSRCQHLRLATPAPDVALAWLAGLGVKDSSDAQTLLTACSGRPLDALALAQAGVNGEAWSALPNAVAHGQAGALAGWPVPRALDALQKLCHDALSRVCGGPAQFFAAQRVPAHGRPAELAAWSRELARVARHEEHPWNEGLLLDALVQRGAAALRAPTAHAAARPRGFDTLPQ